MAPILDDKGRVITTPCKIWEGSIKDNGYGQDSAGRAKHGTGYPHRIAWIKAHGSIPDETPHILHHCDTPACYEITHLYAGTHQQNMDDKVRRKRQYRPIGELNTRAKLTEEQVRKICERYATDSHLRQWQLAEEYGVTQQCISHLVREKRWNYDL